MPRSLSPRRLADPHAPLARTAPMRRAPYPDGPGCTLAYRELTRFDNALRAQSKPTVEMSAWDVVTALSPFNKPVYHPRHLTLEVHPLRPTPRVWVPLTSGARANAAGPRPDRASMARAREVRAGRPAARVAADEHHPGTGEW